MSPVIPLLGIYPRKIETYIQAKTFLRMFMETLFKIIQNGNNQMCINRRTDKQTTVYSHHVLLPRNKNGHSNDMHHRRISVFMVSARSQAKERMLYMIPFV